MDITPFGTPPPPTRCNIIILPETHQKTLNLRARETRSKKKLQLESKEASCAQLAAEMALGSFGCLRVWLAFMYSVNGSQPRLLCCYLSGVASSALRSVVDSSIQTCADWLYSTLAANRRAEALHVVPFRTMYPTAAPSCCCYCCCYCCVWYRMRRSHERPALGALLLLAGPSPRAPISSCSVDEEWRGDCVRASWLYSKSYATIATLRPCVPRTAAPGSAQSDFHRCHFSIWKSNGPAERWKWCLRKTSQHGRVVRFCSKIWRLRPLDLKPDLIPSYQAVQQIAVTTSGQHAV